MTFWDFADKHTSVLCVFGFFAMISIRAVSDAIWRLK